MGAVGPAVVQALDNGLALTPQMGWNTWNRFGCNISETLVVGAAKAFIEHNLTAYGYEYIIMDDCWHADSRDPDTGAPRANTERFPNGIKGVADQVHALGLKIGIYSDAGKYTCGGKFGSLGFEEIDAKTYAEWGIDYLKYDNCFNEGQAGTPEISYNRYAKMSKALNATGRPILYSICNWGEDGPWNFAPTIANSWRISGDIMDSFDRYDERCPCTSVIDCKLAGYHCSMARIIDYAAPLLQKARKGAWNDMDMMEVGLGGMNYDEYVTHFSFWAMLKSPMLLGMDLTSMSNETLSIITNDAIIALNQDPLASVPNRQWKRDVPEGGSIQLWQGSLVNNTYVIALMNSSPKKQTVDVEFFDAFFDQGKTYQKQPYRLYDLWQKDGKGKWGKDLGIFQGSIPNVKIGVHQTKVWLAKPAPSGHNQEL
ncbi:alpha-galactosidase [Cristinia sonorae]|uniref:Alpha-galactosidase n=1 Tax=Cristinia sonorae TaxID=1940300 RepID=A0A8K0XN52_9AGAR|nr:alpha-galactosidase [Cristinia sonorae]